MGGCEHRAGDTAMGQPCRNPAGNDGVSCHLPLPLLLTLLSQNRWGSLRRDRGVWGLGWGLALPALGFCALGWGEGRSGNRGAGMWGLPSLGQESGFMLVGCCNPRRQPCELWSYCPLS